MNAQVARMRFGWFFLTVFFATVANLSAGPEPLAGDDGKDYSKELPPIEKSWCEPPPPWEIKIGLPGWLSGISGDTGVKGVVTNIDVSFDQLLRHLTHVPIVLS